MVRYQPADNQVAILGFHGSNYTGAAVHTRTADLGDGPERALLFQDAFTHETRTTAQA